MNVAASPDERYFDWLYSKVASIKHRDPSESYILLCAQLYKTPFRWHVRNDENRADDGYSLRREYVHLAAEEVDRYWMKEDCSIFEMLIALADRAAFQTNWELDQWFWHMLDNLGIGLHDDENYPPSVQRNVEAILERFNERNYEYNGQGGVFPLRDPERDQREEELWYQLSAYLFENFE